MYRFDLNEQSDEEKVSLPPAISSSATITTQKKHVASIRGEGQAFATKKGKKSEESCRPEWTDRLKELGKLHTKLMAELEESNRM